MAWTARSPKRAGTPSPSATSQRSSGVCCLSIIDGRCELPGSNKHLCSFSTRASSIVPQNGLSSSHLGYAVSRSGKWQGAGRHRSGWHRLGSSFSRDFVSDSHRSGRHRSGWQDPGGHHRSGWRRSGWRRSGWHRSGRHRSGRHGPGWHGSGWHRSNWHRSIWHRTFCSQTNSREVLAPHCNDAVRPRLVVSLLTTGLPYSRQQ